MYSFNYHVYTPHIGTMTNPLNRLLVLEIFSDKAADTQTDTSIRRLRIRVA